MINDLRCSVTGCEAKDGVDLETHCRVEAVCERIVNSFLEPVEFKGAQMKTSASIGVALYRQHGSTPEALYKASDVALYEAKRAGKNTWRWNQQRAPAEVQARPNPSTKSIHPPSITPPDSSGFRGSLEGA